MEENQCACRRTRHTDRRRRESQHAQCRFQQRRPYSRQSTPVVSGMVACLWQALRDKTALEIIDLVRRCSDNYSTPDNIYGYGVPDFWRAYVMGRQQNRSK